MSGERRLNTNHSASIVCVNHVVNRALTIDYDEDTEIGRSVVYQRAASKNDPKGYEEYVLDPAYWMTSHEPVTTDIKGIGPRWYIGVYPMPYPTSGIPKAAPPVTKK